MANKESQPSATFTYTPDGAPIVETWQGGTLELYQAVPGEIDLFVHAVNATNVSQRIYKEVRLYHRQGTSGTFSQIAVQDTGNSSSPTGIDYLLIVNAIGLDPIDITQTHQFYVTGIWEE